MAIEGIRTVNLKEPFSMGLIDGNWLTIIPDQYSPYLRNVRVKNNVVTSRPWYASIIESATGTYIRGLVSTQWTMYTCTNSLFQIVDTTNRYIYPAHDITFSADFVTSNVINMDVNAVAMTTVNFDTDNDTTLAAIATQLQTQFSEISSATIVNSWSSDRIIKIVPADWSTVSITNIAVTSWASQPTWTFDTGSIWVDNDVDLVSFGKYTIIYTWSTPYYYDWDSLNTVSTVAAGANLRFAEKFAWYTFAAWGWDNKNVLYISRPVTLTNPEYAFDYTWSGSQQLYLNSDIQWLVATLDRIYIFTEKTIESIDRSSLANVGWSWTFYTTPVAAWEELASFKSAVAAWDRIFFLTKNKQIKTVNFISGIAELEVWKLSDTEWSSIQKFLNNNLNDTLTASFWYFNKITSTVHFHVRGIASIFNDLTIVYDLVNQTFLIDNNKFFNVATEHNWEFYCWSIINSDIYKDEVWTDDNAANIEWEYRTPEHFLWNNSIRKIFRELRFSWTINSQTTINYEILVDWQEVYSSSVSWSDVVVWIGGQAIWEEAIWDVEDVDTLANFRRLIGRSYLYTKWYNLQIIFSWQWVAQNFSLDTMSIWFKMLWDVEIADK